ncbi:MULTISPECIES: thioredoxin family protein [unclassified Staphylococcus]|uniref:thioredoxin family protein n=1 Tax=unclassified Staphylococcus TaxID=91994 RepID=UPI0021CFEFF0|nr:MULTISPECIES: thioredoxin family protein [unclassified Staphylococcus]UXR68873.1 thioredoxin family protein [Staphylococcus sp. IVB6246]UXR70930.1 thioredoxin family protein [Staphylococcus sp. IVB6240]UXR73160.1 thioredoxin family protein [Staphylococcus sp. IVB6238]UXR75456.1 thioredoxin family protein [Staphylococcus sp. IVB6233]UXR79659.1 thioredoxin family protein [Staphylococcus sp. IVB6218]
MKNLETLEQYQSLKQEETVFLYSADWCPDCRVIEPGLPEIEEKYSQFNFVKVDRDQFVDLAIEEGVMGIPSFLVYKNGERVGDYIGKERKSIEQIDTFLSQF